MNAPPNTPVQARLRALVRDVPDFPKPGILFRDITPLLSDAAAFRLAVEELTARIRPLRPDVGAAVEARGFLVGAAVALASGCGIIPIRKPGKLPYRSRRVTYALEYGTDTLEVHEDAIAPGQRVVLLDDVLATGGTLAGAADLVRQSGARVAACAVLLELTALKGRDRLPGIEMIALLSY